MATNSVTLVGDRMHLLLTATNDTGPDPLEFLSGSFRSSPEERRVANAFLVTAGGAKTFELRFEFTDPKFIEHSITGAPVYRGIIEEGVEAQPYQAGPARLR